MEMKKIGFFDHKDIQYYNGLRIMADTGLHDQLAAIVVSLLPKNSSVLDFGAGEGALSQRLSDLGYRITSVDKNREDFKASTEFVEINFNDSEQKSSIFEKYHEYFDLVLGIEVIEHLENPWQYIRDLKSFIKPGGFMIVSTPNITSWYSRVYFLFRGQFPQFLEDSRPYGHINPINIDELQLIIKSNDLSILKVQPAGWLPILWVRKSLKSTLLNIFGFLSRFFMTGIKDGWCIICISQKST